MQRNYKQNYILGIWFTKEMSGYIEHLYKGDKPVDDEAYINKKHGGQANEIYFLINDIAELMVENNLTISFTDREVRAKYFRDLRRYDLTSSIKTYNTIRRAKTIIDKEYGDLIKTAIIKLPSDLEEIMYEEYLKTLTMTKNDLKENIKGDIKMNNVNKFYALWNDKTNSIIVTTNMRYRDVPDLRYNDYGLDQAIEQLDKNATRQEIIDYILNEDNLTEVISTSEKDILDNVKEELVKDKALKVKEYTKEEILKELNRNNDMYHFNDYINMIEAALRDKELNEGVDTDLNPNDFRNNQLEWLLNLPEGYLVAISACVGTDCSLTDTMESMLRTEVDYIKVVGKWDGVEETSFLAFTEDENMAKALVQTGILDFNQEDVYVWKTPMTMADITEGTNEGTRLDGKYYYFDLDKIVMKRDNVIMENKNESTLTEGLINTREFINGVNNSSRDYYEKTIRFFGGGGVIITLTSLIELYVTDIDTNETILFTTLKTSPANTYDWGWELRDKLLDLEIILKRGNYMKELEYLKENTKVINENRIDVMEKYKDIIEDVIGSVEKDPEWLDDLNMLIFDIALDHFERKENKHKAYELIAENWEIAKDQVAELDFDVEAMAAAVAPNTYIGEAIREYIKQNILNKELEENTKEINENITEDNLTIVLNYVFNTDEDGDQYGDSFLYDIDIWKDNGLYPTTKPVYQTYREMMDGEHYDINYKLRQALQEAYPEYEIDYAELMGDLYDMTAVINYLDEDGDYIDIQVPVQVVDVEDTAWDDETRLGFWA